jgi:hypothetical protein
MSRHSGALLLVVLVIGCARGRAVPGADRHPSATLDGSSSASADTDKSLVALDLYEPVVRHLLKALETRASTHPWVVYVVLPVGLSGEAFCARFAGNAIPIHPYEDTAGDTATRSAYFINICNPTARKVRWEGTDRASILVTHYAASEPACGCEKPAAIPVRREGDQWVVVER